MLAAPRRSRVVAYVGANILFAVVMAIGYGVGGQPNPRILYLFLLFALCSTAIIDLDGLNGRYSLLALFLAMYFVYYGLQDLTNLFDSEIGETPEGMLSLTEMLVLVGGVMLVIGYRIAAKIGNPQGSALLSTDWPTRSIAFAGIAMWAIGFAATYFWYFYVVTDKSVEADKGIGRLSPIFVAGLILAQILQPLSTLLLAYAWRTTRRPHFLALVLIVVSIQVLLGFVIDIKGMALTGGLLVIFTIVFTEGRIPKLWLAGVFVFIYAAFPVFQAYRAVVTGNNVARSEVLDNLGKTLDAVLAAKTKVNTGTARAQTFFERLSMKGSVAMIVHGTENGIPFQHGYTLTPILSTFLPRFLWSDKPDVPVGRIVNKVFHVTDQEETYISPSHLGELYWNFGWSGVLVGMTVIGALCGFISRFNLAEYKSVTRLLVIGLTVELVIHGFEGSLAGSYVVWLRCFAAVLILHFLFARETGVRRADQPDAASWERQPTIVRFPNLLT